jgi:hypothetical protein
MWYLISVAVVVFVADPFLLHNIWSLCRFLKVSIIFLTGAILSNKEIRTNPTCILILNLAVSDLGISIVVNSFTVVGRLKIYEQIYFFIFYFLSETNIRIIWLLCLLFLFQRSIRRQEILWSKYGSLCIHWRILSYFVCYISAHDGIFSF